MNMTSKLLLLCLLMIGSHSALAFNKFFCQCRGTGPGYEETNRDTGGIDKICSYSCNCVAWDVKQKPNGDFVAQSAVPNISLNVNKKATTATSREQWDFGSHICHGQYSYKPNLSDPNWKIEVRFDTFAINNEGDVFYDEEARREIAQGMNLVGFKYSKKAKEIAASLTEQLKNRK
jgi:hypothetical protein